MFEELIIMIYETCFYFAGAIGYHTSPPLVSTAKADFQSIVDISATAIKRPLVKAHGNI
jgi:hypothetical protein